MLKFIPLILLIFSFNNSFCQEAVLPETLANDLIVADVKDGNWLAMSKCGDLWFSTDDGFTWDYIHIDYRYGSHISIYETGGKYYAMVLSGSSLYRFDFSSKNLTQIDHTYTIADALVLDQTLFIFTSTSIISSDVTTIDWEEIYTGGSNFSEIDYEQGKFFISSTDNKLHVYDIATKTLEELYTFNSRIRNFDFGTNQVGYVSSDRLYKTTDGGHTFVELNAPENINPQAYGENIVVTINTNRNYRSVDGGATFEYSKTFYTNSFSYIRYAFFDESGILYLVGAGRTVARSKDYALTYEVLNNNFNRNFNNISAYDDTYLSTSYYSTAVKSTDFGESWQFIDLQQEYDIQDCLVDSDKHLIIATKQGLYKITESGETLLDDGYYIQIIQKGVDYYSVIYEGEYKLYKSNDLENWSFVQKYDDYAELTMSYDGSIISLSPTRIDRLKEGETQWDSLTFEGFDNIKHLNYLSEDTILIINATTLIKSVDSGNSFDTIATGYDLKNLKIISPETFIYTTSQSSKANLFITENGGEKFTSFTKMCPVVYEMILSGNNLFSAHASGHIFKTELSPKSSVQSTSSDLDIHIFPNPLYTQSFNIIWEDSEADLTIVDINGKLIDNHHIQLGMNKIKCEYKPGIYFVIISKNGDIISTEKLIKY